MDNTIKEMLRNGMSPTEITKLISDAQREIEAEKKAAEAERVKQEEIADARADAIESILLYYEMRDNVSFTEEENKILEKEIGEYLDSLKFSVKTYNNRKADKSYDSWLDMMMKLLDEK